MESNKELNKESKKTVNKKLIVITAAIATAVCIVAAAVIFSIGSGTDKRLAEQLDLAERYLSELDYEQAIIAYQAAIEIDPKCEEAYLGLADIYIEQEKYEEAVEILEAGLAQIDSEATRSKLEEVKGLMAKGTAQEYVVRQEYDQNEQDRNEQEGTGTKLQAHEFYEKYAELYSLVDEAFIGRYYECYDRYLTFEEREQAYSGLAEQLEQYLADLGETEGLGEELYGADSVTLVYKNSKYFTKGDAYRYLAEAYLRMGKLEECLRVRTEWAAFANRPDLVQDGNNGYNMVEGLEFDKYGRKTAYIYDVYGDVYQYIYVYEESHDGATHMKYIGPEVLQEYDYTYDREGRILHRQEVYEVIENEGVAIMEDDYDYVYTGNHSFLMTATCVWTDGYVSDPTQYEEQFYDTYGNIIYQ